MTALQYGLLTALLVGFGLLEYLLGRAQQFKATVPDNILDILGFILLAALTQPLIMLFTAKIGWALAPQYRNALADLPWYANGGLAADRR